MNHWPRIDIRINLHDILFERLDGAIEYGWNRAHKHTDKPTPEMIREEISKAIGDAIYELLSWGDDTEGEE